MRERIELIQGDITKIEVECIVNAANSSLLGGSGVDGAIHRAAGSELVMECRLLGGCKTVGPVYRDGQHNESELLTDCYNNSLALAEKSGIKAIAFPCISTGIYRYPFEEACRIAISTINAFLNKCNTINKLWEVFGGNINSKGYKVLDSHIKAIYGDSITSQRAESIYKILIENGFACNNVSLGSGSFSMQCLEQDDELNPFTRDTYGIAIKATYCEVNGKPIQIFKDPKTDIGHFKKSQRGMCVVYRNKDGELDYKDGFDTVTIESFKGENLLKPVFADGKMLKEQSLAEIRNILHGGKF
ncbi:ganglioside induced differentiation associated protein 2-related [Holotrichia oblita]|nr:ganglioside induced differentiation associated protein 2-related [Holotrichia oblita]